MREYLVRKHGSGIRAQWTVAVGDEVHGDYLSEWAALLDAVDAAQADGENGLPARVLIAREKDAADLVWSVGDPYPSLVMPAAEGDGGGDHSRA